MAFDSQVRCDIETIDVTINNYERMANAPDAWERIKKLVEEKLKSPNKTHIAICPKCHGDGGMSIDGGCSNCHGTGEVKQQ